MISWQQKHSALTVGLWDTAYRLAEREKWWMDTLPSRLGRVAPQWPIDDTVAIDVGASVGSYTRSFARWCSKVYAIEPNAILAKDLGDQDLHNVQVGEFAAGEVEGVGHLTDQSVSGYRRPLARLGEPDNAAWSQACLVKRLDDIVEPRPTALVVKVDTEGTEASVIKGMAGLLTVPNLLLMIEIEMRHNKNYAAVFDMLRRFRLDAYRLHLRRLIKATASDVEKAAKGPGGRLSAFWPWSNNFLFMSQDLACSFQQRKPVKNAD